LARPSSAQALSRRISTIRSRPRSSVRTPSQSTGFPPTSWVTSAFARPEPRRGEFGLRPRALGHLRQGHGPARRAASGRVHAGVIRTYNTCAGPDYIRKATGQQSANFGLGQSDLDDLTGFLTRADELALSLMDEGITAMKIWPFDTAAEATRGPAHLGRRPEDRARAVREDPPRCGRRHGHHGGVPFDVAAPARHPHRPRARPLRHLLARGSDPHGFLGDLRRYAEASPAPVCASETLGSRAAFRDLLETGAAGIVMLDVAWCGGLSEARKIAAMAEAWHLPVAPHDCTGPVVLAASTHLSLNAPNALIQESVRAFYRGWYRDVVTALPPIAAAPSPYPRARASASRSCPISTGAGQWRGAGRPAPTSDLLFRARSVEIDPEGRGRPVEPRKLKNALQRVGFRRTGAARGKHGIHRGLAGRPE
jgi:hypothetical protein